jgi:uncharacterized protein YoxC
MSSRKEMHEFDSVHFSSALLVVFVFFALLFIFPGNNITGQFSVLDVAPSNYQFIKPDDVSQDAAKRSLENALADIEIIRAQNVSTQFALDAHREAHAFYDQGEYTAVFPITELVTFIKHETIELGDKAMLLQQDIQAAADQGIDVNKSVVFWNEALVSLRQQQLDDTRRQLARSSEELEAARNEQSRVATIVLLGKNFFVRYWWQILVVVATLVALSFPVGKRIRKWRLRRTRDRLKAELAKSQEMIRKMQIICFKEKKITVETYKAKVTHYEERIAEIKHTLPVVQAQLKGRLYKGKNQKAILKVES